MVNLSKVVVLTALVVGVLPTFCSHQVLASGGVRTVALTGQSAPGTETGTQFDSFRMPDLNNAGQTAFFATLTGNGVDNSNEKGIWSEGRSNGLALIARKGDEAPGTNATFNFRSEGFTDPGLTDNGKTFFENFASVPGKGEIGLWTDQEDRSLALVVHAGDAVPGTDSEVAIRDVSWVFANDQGEFAFHTLLKGQGVNNTNDRAVWRSVVGGDLIEVARKGSQAPGLEAGVHFTSVFLTGLNEAGHIVISGTLAGPGIDQTNNSGIWSDRGGNGLVPIILAGDVAPIPDATFLDVGSVLINEMDQIAFETKLSGDVGDSVWSEGKSGGLELVARAGQLAPGTEGDTRFDRIIPAILNDSGRMAILALVDSPEISEAFVGIWSQGIGDGLKLVARTGDTIPGLAEGVVVNFFGTGPLLNARGQVAFQAVLTDQSLGIWAQGTNGGLQEIALEGRFLDVSDDPRLPDLREIRDLKFSDGGRQSGGLNDFGEVAFAATFTDGSSGVFVSSLVAIPEPSCLALLGCAMFALVGRTASHTR